MGCCASTENVSVIDSKSRLGSRVAIDGKLEFTVSKGMPPRSTSSIKRLSKISVNNNPTINNTNNIILLKDKESASTNTTTVKNFEYESLVFGQDLGSGSFGKVQAATTQGDSEFIFAVKTFFLPSEESEIEKMKIAFDNEVDLLSRISHPNIVTFLGSIRSHFVIIFEMCQGSLQDLIKTTAEKQISVEQSVAIKIGLGCANACSYLEKQGIMHRDLKGSNVLLTSSFDCKLSDFGLSTDLEVQANHSTYCGTRLWLAPEILKGDTYSSKADVYSFGILLWEIFNFEKPYSEYGINTTSLPYLIAEKNLRPTLRSSTPIQLQELIRDCWEALPENRPAFDLIAKRLEFLRDAELFDRTRTCSIIPAQKGRYIGSSGRIKAVDTTATSNRTRSMKNI